MRIDENERLSNNNADSQGGLLWPFFASVFGLVLSGAAIWEFKCELGFGVCTDQIYGVEVDVLEGSEEQRLLKWFQEEPCNKDFAKQFVKTFDSQLMDREVGQFFANFASTADCSFKPFDRSYFMIEAFKRAHRAGDQELSKKWLVESIKYDPYDASAYLTLAGVEFNEGNHDSSVTAFKLAVYYSNTDYTRLPVNALWEYAESLVGTKKYCEALTVLEILRDRTNGQARVVAKIDKLDRTKACRFASGSPFSLTEGRKGVIVVPVEINGAEAKFVFDTGASLTLLSERLAKKLGVKPAYNFGRKVQTANGVVVAYPVVLESVVLGGDEWTDIDAIVSEGDLGQFDGLLGLDFISRYNIEKNGSKWTLTKR